MTPSIKADIDRERSIKHNKNKKARRENARRLTIQNEQAKGINTVKENKRTYKQKLEARKKIHGSGDDR
jgi:hypothetical protein